jgi:DNA invertase Pin-like site-specific DNA recombinase
MKKRQPADTDTRLARAVLYIRVSTEDQNLGPDAQRAAAARWATANGVEISAEHEDHGLCGELDLTERPGLLAAVDDLARVGATILLVAKRDRLSRGDPVATAMIERLVQRTGARVVSAAGEGTDSDDPGAVLMRRLVDAFAEYELRIIRARTRAALAVKRSRGEYTGGEAPFGFTSNATGKLEPHPGEQQVIAAARRLREQGLSLRAIAAELDQAGLRSREGRRFSPNAIMTYLARAVG